MNLDVPVKVVMKSFRGGAKYPVKSTHNSVGYDIFAWTELKSNGSRSLEYIYPGELKIIKTGINFLSIPNEFEVQIRPRSGLAAKKYITVLNTPGTIDPDYVGEGEDFEVRVILYNASKENIFTVEHGDKIAQMVFSYKPKVVLCDENDKEINNEDYLQIRQGGFGSTDGN